MIKQLIKSTQKQSTLNNESLNKPLLIKNIGRDKIDTLKVKIGDPHKTFKKIKQIVYYYL